MVLSSSPLLMLVSKGQIGGPRMEHGRKRECTRCLLTQLRTVEDY